MSSEFIVSFAKEDTPNYDIFSVSCTFYTFTQTLFKSLEILPIDKICIDRIGITMFKITYELVPKSIHQLFSRNKDIHSHDTRNKDLLRAFTGTKNFTFLSSRIWNAIVCNININVSLSRCKYILKIYLLHNTLNFTYSKYVNNLYF